MNRESAIKTLQKMDSELAQEYGYEIMIVGEDRQKGLWGEAMTKHLEETYGECTESIKWKKDENDKEEYVEFRFRFADPVLTVRRPGEVLCSLELSDYCYDTKEHTGDFVLDQVMVWKCTKGGFELQKELVSRWNKCASRYNESSKNDVVVDNLKFKTKQDACAYYDLGYGEVYRFAKKENLTFEEAIIKMDRSRINVRGIKFNSLTSACVFFQVDIRKVNSIIADGLSEAEAINNCYNYLDDYHKMRADDNVKEYFRRREIRLGRMHSEPIQVG